MDVINLLSSSHHIPSLGSSAGDREMDNNGFPYESEDFNYFLSVFNFFLLATENCNLFVGLQLWCINRFVTLSQPDHIGNVQEREELRRHKLSNL